MFYFGFGIEYFIHVELYPVIGVAMDDVFAGGGVNTMLSCG